MTSQSATGGSATDGRAANGVDLDPWDLRHLLLSIDQRPRGDRDDQDLRGVIIRAAAALSTLPPRPAIVVPEACTAPLHVEGLPLWLFETNAWLLAAGGECVVVDVPPSPGRLVERITGLGLRLRAVLLTHGHSDHTAGAGALLRELGVRVPVYVHPADRDRVLYPDEDGVLGRFVPGLTPPPRRRLLALDDTVAVTLGGLQLRPVPAPGHTAGSTCVLVEGGARPLLCTGDTLFAGRTGRCDLPGGSRAVAEASLGAVLAALPDETVVLPGHGGVTTVGDERRGRPASGPLAA